MSVSVTGLELPTAWTTAQVNNPSFDISADQLNVIANRTISVRGALIDWGTTRHSNASDPTQDQDLTTKKYVDDQDALITPGHIIEDETVPLPQQPDLNFTGDLVTATDNVGNTATDVKIATGFSAKGDLLTSDGVTITPSILAIGLADQILTVDLAEPTGMKWVDPSSAGLPLTTQGDLLTRDATTDIRLGIGSPFQVLTVNSAGLQPEWADAQTGGHTIQNDGINLTQRTNLNFVGALVIATDDLGNDASLITVDGALTDLTDVDTSGEVNNDVLTFNGSLWVPLALTKAQLPTTIAYEDESNVFTLPQTIGGILMTEGLDMNGQVIVQTLSHTYTEQLSNPPDPLLTESTLFLSDGSQFFSPDPVWTVLIDRGGTITPKPVATSETVFALRNFSNGMFREETGTRLVDPSIADTIRVQLFNENTIGDPFVVVLDGLQFEIASPDVSVTTGNSINLSTGTATDPVKHWVWVRNIAGVATLESSLTEFPPGVDFAVVGTFIFQDLASVLADGALAVNSPDYEVFDEITRGHLSHINDRLVNLDAHYVSGIDITVTPTVGGGTATNVTFISSTGKSFELHPEDIEAFDITTGYAVVVNEGTQTPQQVTKVDDIGQDLFGLTCANGTTVIAGANFINVVVYTIHNDDEPNQTNYGVNVPFDVYSGGGALQNAIDDVNGFAIKNVPLNQRGVTLLIAEIVIDITDATTYEVVAIRDLRGQIPGAASSGGSGTGGATELNQLTDVTIVNPLIDQILQFNGAGQWLNVDNPAGLLAGQNVWTDFQDFTEITIPADPATTVGRFYLKRLNVNNVGLFIKMQQAGVVTEVQIA